MSTSLYQIFDDDPFYLSKLPRSELFLFLMKGIFDDWRLSTFRLVTQRSHFYSIQIHGLYNGTQVVKEYAPALMKFKLMSIMPTFSVIQYHSMTERIRSSSRQISGISSKRHLGGLILQKGECRTRHRWTTLVLRCNLQEHRIGNFVETWLSIKYWYCRCSQSV